MENEIRGTIVIIILLVIASLVAYQTFYVENKNGQTQVGTTCNSCPVCPVCPLSQNDQKESPPLIVNVTENSPKPSISPSMIAREYDYRTFNDPLVPPYKRSDYDHNFLPGSGFPQIATRGYPSGFKKMGLLNDESAPNDDKYKFMVIMGRQTYPGSNKYDYYVTENKEESALKFDLKNTHKELNDGDTIAITELGKTYSVKIDRDLGFRYTPFVF